MLYDRGLAAIDSSMSGIDPEAALAKLKEGNARFATSEMSAAKATTARRLETVEAQHPFAMIVACYDSRVAPEIIFDLNIGDAFVIRNAGNIINDFVLAGIEFAVRYLGVRLIVVLGHSNCAAVTAAVASDKAPAHLQSLVSEIQPAVRAARSKGSGDVVAAAIGENARLMADKVREHIDVDDLAKEVRILSAVYHLETGKIVWHQP